MADHYFTIPETTSSVLDNLYDVAAILDCCSSGLLDKSETELHNAGRVMRIASEMIKSICCGVDNIEMGGIESSKPTPADSAAVSRDSCQVLKAVPGNVVPWRAARAD